MSRLKKILALSGAEKRTFLAALWGLPIVYLRLRLFGFKNYLSRLQRTPLATTQLEIDHLTYPTLVSLV